MMNGAAILAMLQHQNAWATKSIRVVFNQCRSSDTGNRIFCNNIIGREFTKPVPRDEILTAAQQVRTRRKVSLTLRPSSGSQLRCSRPRPDPLPQAGEGADYSAASTRFLRLDAAPRASTGFKNAPV